MKKLLRVVQSLLLLFTIITFLLTVIEVTGVRTPLLRFNHPSTINKNNETYDPALGRLDNMQKLQQYGDSLFEVQKEANPSIGPETGYAQLAGKIVREKFFHGYSNYGFDNNYMALLLEPLTGKKLSAIVIANDIVKYPYAACSQQSIVAMELLQRKGYITRKIIFEQGNFDGHFCFEAFYAGSWHFFDTDLEADGSFLDLQGRPSIAALASDDSLLLAAYSHLPKEKVYGVFKNFSYGDPNQFSAPHALLYQKVTKFFSYTASVFLLLAFMLTRWIYLRLCKPTNSTKTKNRSPRMLQGQSLVYFPDYNAPRA